MDMLSLKDIYYECVYLSLWMCVADGIILYLLLLVFGWLCIFISSWMVVPVRTYAMGGDLSPVSNLAKLAQMIATFQTRWPK